MWDLEASSGADAGCKLKCNILYCDELWVIISLKSGEGCTPGGRTCNVCKSGEVWTFGFSIYGGGPAPSGEAHDS